jgi:hypothetical protein
MSRCPLRFPSLHRVSAPEFNAEKLVKYNSQVDVPCPPIPLVQSEGDAIASVDLGKQPSIKGIKDMAAKHAGILHYRV